MADQKEPVTADRDHDRVVMLSRRADGTPDQHAPELIGPKDDAVKASAHQIAVQTNADDEAAVRRAKSEVDKLHRG